MMERKNKIELLKNLQNGKISIQDLKPKFIEMKIGLPPFPKFLLDERGKPMIPKIQEEIYV